MRDIEDADSGSDRTMLDNNALVLDRHLPTTEVGQLGTGSDMSFK